MKARSIKGKSVAEISVAFNQSITDTRLPDGQGFFLSRHSYFFLSKYSFINLPAKSISAFGVFCVFF